MQKLAVWVLTSVLLVLAGALLWSALAHPDTDADLITRQIMQDRANATATAVAVLAETRQAAVRQEWAPFTWGLCITLIGLLVVAGGYALFHDLRVDVALRWRATAFVYPVGGYLPVSAESILRDSTLAYRHDRALEAARGASRRTQITHQHDQRRLGPGWGGPPGGAVLDAVPAEALLPAAPETPAIRLSDLFDARAFFGDELLVAFHRATRAPIRMRWDQFIAPIFAGKPRNGKTSGLAFSVLSFALYLANLGLDCKIVAFDPHYGAADSLSARLAGLSSWFLAPPGTTWRDLERFCGYLTGELERRKALPFARWGGGLIFLVDEMSSIFVRLDSDPDRLEWARVAALFATTMYLLNTQGPKYLITVWGATHEISANAMSARGNDSLIRQAVSTWIVFNLEPGAVQSHLRWSRRLADAIGAQVPGQAVLMNHLSGLPATEIVYPQVPGEDLRRGVRLAQETIRERARSGAVTMPQAMPWRQETNTLTAVEWPNVLDTLVQDDEWAEALDRMAQAGAEGPVAAAEASVAREVHEVVEVPPPPLEGETAILPAVPAGPEGAASGPTAPAPPAETPAAWRTWVALCKELETGTLQGRELPEAHQEYLAFVLTKMMGLSQTATLKTLWGVEGGANWAVYTRKLRDWATTWANTGPPAQPVLE